MKNSEIKEHNCFGGCGQKVAYIPRFEGLPCNDYCCRCCGYSKISPCPKDKREGSMFEQLAKLQNEQ